MSTNSADKFNSYISFLLFKIPITISLILFIFGKNNYTQKQTFFSTINADSVIAKEIIREPKLLGRWFSFTDDHSAFKQILKSKPSEGRIFHNAIYRHLDHDYDVKIFYLKDQLIRAKGQKYNFVSFPLPFFKELTPQGSIRSSHLKPCSHQGEYQISPWACTEHHSCSDGC